MTGTVHNEMLYSDTARSTYPVVQKDKLLQFHKILHLTIHIQIAITRKYDSKRCSKRHIGLKKWLRDASPWAYRLCNDSLRQPYICTVLTSCHSRSAPACSNACIITRKITIVIK